jgi:hypothetical protein
VPTEPLPSSAPGLHRRTALGALVALGAAGAGCTRQPEKQAPSAPVRQPEEDPDVALVTGVLTAEQGVLDLVESVLARHRDLRTLLTSTRDVHRAHIELLAAAVPTDGKASDSPSSSASASASVSPSAAVPVPSRPAQALTVVVRAEDQLCLVDKRSAFAAESGAFARILASMAAAAAQQSARLRQRPQAGAGR